MTSFAFIFGLLPLLFATGAGALARRSLGTAVIGGMLVSTALNLFVIPVFYVLFVRNRKKRDEEPPVDKPPFEEGGVSVSDVFEEPPAEEKEENGKKAGLINFIKEENEDNAPPDSEPKIVDRKDDKTKEDPPDKAETDDVKNS